MPRSSKAATELEELRARLEEAERSSEEKTRFIRHVSHEFRTPLSSIIGFGALLQREGEGEVLAPAVRAEYLEIVLRNARHLLHVVNDLLNISKVEAGKLEVTLAPVRVPDVIGAVVTALGPAAEDRDIRLTIEDAGAPYALADSGRLRQVLFNLMENAIKYSPPGAEVIVRARGAEDGVRVEVEDRGPGISRRDQARLFKEFSRVNPPGMRVIGAGLGLALSRMLAEAMGGRIGVESVPGRGSTFWVALPAAPDPAGAAAAPARSAAPRRRTETVGIVDDDPDLRAYAVAVLQRAGYRAAADDGAPGVAGRLAEARPAIILLDMNLAGRTGIEALAELRAIRALDTVPVLAFTAASLADLPMEGFAGRVSKPVEPDALLAQVDAAVETLAARVADAERDADEDDFLAPLRARFRAGLGSRRLSIESAQGQGDRESLRRELHKLRGTAGGYGYDALAEAAGAAEEAVRAGEGVAEVARLVALLRAETEEG
ncbi:hybrid sensor histidine kinase/response regulator [Longimicrobium sp.]|uniref:hybrid sensor histidine kinase/response regulator n=1 Tax=Longimicrobium sp. TaxID=2029185 RepID=UPI003B3AC176